MKKRILTLFALCAALILLTAGAQAEGTAVQTIHVENAEHLMQQLTDGASGRIILLDAKDYVIYSEHFLTGNQHPWQRANPLLFKSMHRQTSASPRTLRPSPARK